MLEAEARPPRHEYAKYKAWRSVVSEAAIRSLGFVRLRRFDHYANFFSTVA